MLTLAFAALLMPLELNLVGRLTGADMILLLAFPILIAKRRNALKTPAMKTFYALLGFWFFGAFITDVIRQTPLEDVARGWAKIIVFGFDFGSVVMLVNGKLSRAVMFSILTMIGLSIKLRLNIDGSGIGDDVFGNAWKYGYGTTFTAAVFLTSSFLLRSLPFRPIGVVMPYAAAAVDLLLNARSIFGQAALAALIQSITALRRKPMRAGQIAMLAVVCALAGQGILSLYGYAASQGYLSREAKEKYEEQSKGSLGLLLGGRNESLASTEAIKDSPIIGHGSWARDRYYVDLMISRLEEAGYDVHESSEQSDLIPSHSHLLGAWVESGIAGGIFWFWIGWRTLRGLFSAVSTPGPLTGFTVFLGFSLLWDVLFSPFGLDARIYNSAWILVMFLSSGKPRQLSKGAGNEILSRHNIVQSGRIPRAHHQISRLADRR